ncbi:MAG: elongation factor Ts [Bacteroidetes bacterium]|nr:elongation factor Ts [Bacteroidota bacterium]MBP6402819.1 elongation factor Ts [Bacteroidia bacterium]MBK9526331.1 elongation factor Ts [Bacteroidota bacterium]MBK9544088.1 elongation factor Ts [Bacteroidota bacterium]MBL0256761.1 elongation factor Ts [Bacteroidota bacterium]
MSTVAISAGDVNKLRQQTGAGMMDCKKALTEANGDFEAAIDILRKKGQKIAANRQDREAKEGYVYGKVTADGKTGVVVAVCCETDFVAKNADFIKYGESILELAVANKPASADDLKNLKLGNQTVGESLIEQMGKIGEKIDVVDYQLVNSDKVIVYNHPGNKLASMIGFNSAPAGIDDAGRDVAMQTAAMAPVAIDKDDVDAKTLEREIEIGKDQARQEGKPENMIEKIALGKLNKFYNEYTLLNQVFIKDEKKTVRQYLESIDKNLKVTAMKRVKLG